MADSDDGALYPKREFRSVETEFSLDPDRKLKLSGYRPLWRLPQAGADPIFVGLCEMTLVGKDAIRPGETLRADWAFVPAVQGYIEQYVKPGDVIDICEGSRRVGSVRVLSFVF